MAMELRGARGEGFATITADGRVLDSWFLRLSLVAETDKAATVRLTSDEINGTLGESADGYARHDDIRNVDIVPIRTEIDSLASAPTDVHDAYLRLHLLSHRLVQPNCVNLEGIFSLLPNVAWTTLGPCECPRVPEAQIAARKRALAFEVTGVDKFPRMTDYVTPADVRIADADRVRLGAYLAPGTTVMHEGFCNFNAGTLGPCMVEGRISAGVVVGSGSDVGGGASIMGTLSGGGKERIRTLPDRSQRRYRHFIG
jgi:2,3,4,5-tetrahydropyridine-2-carboxylate N-succinyltransferase